MAFTSLDGARLLCVHCSDDNRDVFQQASAMSSKMLPTRHFDIFQTVVAKVFLLCCKDATSELLFTRMPIFPAADMSISKFRQQRQWSDCCALKSLLRCPRVLHHTSGATRGQHSQEERARL